MTVLLRIAALIGYVAHRIDLSLGWLTRFLPTRVPAALLMLPLLVVGAWSTAASMADAIASLPRPVRQSVPEMVADRSDRWVQVSGLISGPHLDSTVYASDDVHFVRVRDEPHDHQKIHGEVLVEPGWRRQTIFRLDPGDGVTRWFYVLRDPASGADAVIVRSARGGEAIRTRSVRVAAEESDDGTPLLTELADAEDAAPEARVDSVGTDDPALVRAVFGPATEMACAGGPACHDGSSWRYRVVDVADAHAVAWINSPHAPDALPVTLVGVATTDATRMQIVLDTDEMRDALAGLRYPTRLVLADGAGPILPEASYVLPVALGVLAALIGLSLLIGYPVFRRRSGDSAVLVPRPVIGELIDARVSGHIPGRTGGQLLTDAPARLGWLSSREFARQAWHLHRDTGVALGDLPHLALVALEGSFVLPLEPLRAALVATSGTVATVAGARPGLEATGPGTGIVMSFATAAERDRARRELDPQAEAPSHGQLPEATPHRERAVRPWAPMATAAALGAAALATMASGVAGLAGGDAAPIGVGLAIASAAFLGALAFGVHRRHPLALDMLPSIGLVGLVVGAVVAVASYSCGSWLMPSLTLCAATVEPLRFVTPLTVLGASGLSLWATPHLVQGPR